VLDGIQQRVGMLRAATRGAATIGRVNRTMHAVQIIRSQFLSIGAAGAFLISTPLDGSETRHVRGDRRTGGVPMAV
jgi:hypothetical protein